MRVDTDTGLLHLANLKAICKELDMELAIEFPFKPDSTDAQFEKMADEVQKTGAQMMFNHGGIGRYEKSFERHVPRVWKLLFTALTPARRRWLKRWASCRTA